jgi:hypothetical protein
MKYDKYSYIFPPRPKNAVNPDELNFWDNHSLIGQPKLNGSNCTIYTNGTQSIVMNRHNQRLSNFDLSQPEIKSLFRGSNSKWLVLNGEYLNKSKKDETGNEFNHKFIIFDILVYNSDYLVGRTFEERIKILDELYGTNKSEKSYLYSINENTYRVKSFETGFTSLFEALTPIDVIEGLVLKRKSARLEMGTTENNNIKSQIKSRKPTKLYKY